MALSEVVIDTRPFRRILLERAGRPALLVASALLYWLIVSREPPEGLSHEGLAAIGVFSVCLVLWVTTALPLMVTSLLVLVLLPVTGVLPAGKTYGLFGNEAVFFILGVFILAAALMKSRLSTRIALVIFHRFGHTPRRLLLSIFLLNAVMAFFMSEHAVAAINFPIILEIVRVLRLQRGRSSYAKALFLAMAWGSSIGGVATLLGGARAPLALSMAREVSGRTFTFALWAAANLPIVAVLLVVGWVVILAFFPIDVKSIREADELIAEKRLALGRMSTQERIIAAVMLGTLACWIVGGEQFGLATVALAGVVLLFILNVVKWSDVEEYVNWGILLMYGGAIVLGAAVNQSGAATWMSAKTIGHWAGDAVSATWIISALGILLTELMSHSAVVALLMPVALGLCPVYHIDPPVMALIVAVPAGLAFTLPVGTPANAIAYSSGYFTIRDMLIPGSILVVVAWVTFNLVANYVWPFLGITLQMPATP